jgi:hypothetical protein
MNRYYLLIITLFLFSNSFSSQSLEELMQEKKNDGGPVAARIWKAAHTKDIHQEAGDRPAKRKHSNDDGQSPGKRFSPIKRERKALESFIDYTNSHLPKKGISLPDGTTPLNASTVLAASLRLINVGTAEHFIRCQRFVRDKENPDTGQIVLQAEIDFDRRDDKKRTNLERMQIGRAPKGADGKSMNLHHLNQDDGLLVELTRSTHTKLYGALHFRLTPGSSRIDRDQFNSFRSWYWRRRAKEELLDTKIKKVLFQDSTKPSAIPPIRA